MPLQQCRCCTNVFKYEVNHIDIKSILKTALSSCTQLCTVGLSQHVPIMRLCIGKLRMFVEDSDQNLKYLGLVALGSIMKIHPKAVAEHRDLILACLDDPDISIRQRALVSFVFGCIHVFLFLIFVFFRRVC